MTATPVTETARAKINLALHVVARRDDGYHVLDSLVAFAEAGDQLEIKPAEHMSLEVTGPFAAQLSQYSSNIVLAAAEAICEAWPGQIGPAAIRLEKNLPVASGIGGGSADAAAVLRGLARLSGHSADAAKLNEIAVKLGADVPVCLVAKTCRMTGIGEQLQPFAHFPQFPALLVNPLVPLSTRQNFARLGLKAAETAFEPMPKLLDGAVDVAGWAAWLSTCRNDLQALAIAMVPKIAEILAAIGEMPSCLLQRMSGSGATCFGLFETRQAADDAATRISTDHPDWWVCPTVIG